MKTKLTLTVKKSAITAAKKRAKSNGMSLSQMIEGIFEAAETNGIKTEAQRASERLLQTLQKSKTVKTRKDKELIKSHVKRKFA